MTNENSGNTESGNIATIVTVVILAALAIIFFMYGLPMIQNSNAQPESDNTTIDIKLPTPIEPQQPAPTTP